MTIGYLKDEGGVRWLTKTSTSSSNTKRKKKRFTLVIRSVGKKQVEKCPIVKSRPSIRVQQGEILNKRNWVRRKLTRFFHGVRIHTLDVLVELGKDIDI